MERPIITIGRHRYRLTLTPPEQNSCALCDIYDYCMNRSQHWSDTECMGFDTKKDYHLKRID